MSNKETEITTFIDMNQVAEAAGIVGNDKWLSYSQEDVDKCIEIIKRRIERDKADVVHLTGKFPIEVSLALGAFLSQTVMKLEYCRPGVSRRAIFKYESCPEMRT